MFREIEQKKLEMIRNMPAIKDEMYSIREIIVHEWIYNSNALEGSSFTLDEVSQVLSGTMIRGKSLNEHVEVTNHLETISYIEELVNVGGEISEVKIKNIHKLMTQTIDDENAGEYRKENTFIKNLYHIPPEYTEIPNRIAELTMWYQTDAKRINAIEKAILLHNLFLKVCPFGSNDLKIARILINYELMKNGYPPIVIPFIQKKKYEDAINDMDMTKQHEKMLELVCEELTRSMNLFL